VTNDRDEHLDLYARQILERWDAWAEQFEVREELQDNARRRLGARQVNLMDALRRNLES
jgi:hypothetical protein